MLPNGVGTSLLVTWPTSTADAPGDEVVLALSYLDDIVVRQGCRARRRKRNGRIAGNHEGRLLQGSLRRIVSENLVHFERSALYSRKYWSRKVGNGRSYEAGQGQHPFDGKIAQVVAPG